MLSKIKTPLKDFQMILKKGAQFNIPNPDILITILNKLNPEVLRKLDFSQSISKIELDQKQLLTQLNSFTKLKLLGLPNLTSTESVSELVKSLPKIKCIMLNLNNETVAEEILKELMDYEKIRYLVIYGKIKFNLSKAKIKLGQRLWPIEINLVNMVRIADSELLEFEKSFP